MRSRNRLSLQSILEPIVGEKCSGVHFHRMLNLTVSIGAMRRARSDNGRPLGNRSSWWLWVYFSRWSFRQPGHKAVGSYSTSSAILRTVGSLVGKQLRAVIVEASNGTSRWQFTGGCSLIIRPMKIKRGDEMWILYRPDGYVLAVDDLGNWNLAPASGTDKRKQHVWTETGMVEVSAARRTR